MQGEELDAKRTVVPRWLSLAQTPSAELLSSKTVMRGSGERRFSSVLSSAISRWNEDPTICNAADVADAVSLAGYTEAASEPIAQLSRSRESLIRHHSHPVRSVGQRLTSADGARDVTEDEIRRIKKQLIDTPADPLLMVELSRQYVSLGQNKSAKNSMETALRGSPNNRYVLRCAARLFTHIHAPDQAFNAIRKSDAVRSDPWVMAAEVAVADIVGKLPIWGTKQVAAIAGGPTLSRSYSELASALAMLEIGAGSSKRAKKLVVRSMDNPTENVLAQTAWMRNNSVVANVPGGGVIDHSTAFEANLLNAMAQENYDAALKNAVDWLRTEPFSGRAALHGSFVAVGLRRDYELAIRLSDIGLISNPNDLVLLNNKAVALAKLGQIEPAKRILDHLDRSNPSTSRKIYNDALRGLIAYQVGDFLRGRQFYEKAIETAVHEDRRLALQAFSHLLEQEFACGNINPDRATEYFDTIDRFLASKEKGAFKVQSQLWKVTKDQIRKPRRYYSNERLDNLQIPDFFGEDGSKTSFYIH